jgi:6-pyruvoyltetrahydropterin/6-carboxytetrahydropterin synthase
MDFTSVRDIVKCWVDENLDHKMLLRRDDPVAPILEKLGEPIYLLDDNPTAENIAKHIYLQARNQGLNMAEIRLWESPSSYATYREG